MLINITTVNANTSLAPVLEEFWDAKPHNKIPDYWSVDLNIKQMFRLSESLAEIGYAMVVTTSYNLVAGEHLPAIHLHKQG